MIFCCPLKVPPGADRPNRPPLPTPLHIISLTSHCLTRFHHTSPLISQFTQNQIKTMTTSHPLADDGRNNSSESSCYICFYIFTCLPSCIYLSNMFNKFNVLSSTDVTLTGYYYTSSFMHVRIWLIYLVPIIYNAHCASSLQFIIFPVYSVHISKVTLTMKLKVEN